LALATAGAFLSQSALSFKKYLTQYEAKWKVTDSSKQLSDYPSRTLYTTWDLSFRQIEQQNVRAANLLRLLAYFDHQDIWYELLQSGHGEDQPPWFTDLASDEFAFEDAMQTLIRFCLVEAHHETESYSLHVCVHDWTLKGLNAVVDETRYWLAFDCVASHVGTANWDDLSALRFRRFVPHTMRLVHESFHNVRSRQERPCFTETHFLAQLLMEQVQYKAAERMYRRTLAMYEQALGPDHTSTLVAVHNLGNLYRIQGKLALAEEFYRRALTGYEQALGPDHTSTLDSVHSLGNLYRVQGKLALAEEFYLRALTGYEQALGPDHTSTLQAVHSLGNLYRDQGKLALAEEFCLRALTGYEKASQSETIPALNTVRNLGLLYRDQGQTEEAERMFQRAVLGREKVLGPDHSHTLAVANDLEQAKIVARNETKGQSADSGHHLLMKRDRLRSFLRLRS
jgi:tetratricopeptide (TPR) repeat protein